MSDLPAANLRGKRLLVVEDHYLIANELARFLEALGAEVVGPAGAVADALSLIELNGERLHGAVLDVNLRHHERVFPVADALADQGVPFVFTTGYDAVVIPTPYARVPRCIKPIDKVTLARLLSECGVR